jgi:tRNA uridine 5-carboxymethylaminomethyl modification enzyme
LTERAIIERLLATSFIGSQLNQAGIAVRDDGIRRSLAEWLRFPELDAIGLRKLVPELGGRSAVRLEEAVQDHRYAPYVARQQSEIARLKGDEAVQIPADFAFGRVPGLSNEMVERLSRARPSSLGAAARIRASPRRRWPQSWSTRAAGRPDGRARGASLARAQLRCST